MSAATAAYRSLCVLLARDLCKIAKDRYAQRVKTWEAWNDLSVAAQGA